MLPERLFKYVPARFVSSVLGGTLLFRNLAYFRRSEHRARGDAIEGVHVDYPDTPVTLDNVTTGKRTKGRFAFHNHVNAEHVYVYCLSQSLSERLFLEFDSSHCVVIRDVPRFIERCKLAQRRSVIFSRGPFLYGPVTYYAKNRATDIDIKNPNCIPFAKHESFSGQDEFRLVTGMGRFKLHQRIVNGLFHIGAEINHSRLDQRILNVGDLSDIAYLETIHGGPVSFPAPAF